MAAAEEKGDAKDAGQEAGGGAGKAFKLILILTAVNVVVTLAVVAIQLISFKKDRAKASVEDISLAAGEHGGGKEGEGVPGAGRGRKKGHEFGKMVTLELFIVNLSTPGSPNPKFARVNISLEVPTDDVEAEITSKMPQVRNTIIDLFNSKRPSDLAGAEGRDFLKEEIRNALNGFLVNGKVKGVYFTNFHLSA
ncbi:flagellar basal body-associated FliL family protein [Bdellovibrionota bacterium FG-2]